MENLVWGKMTNVNALVLREPVMLKIKSHKDLVQPTPHSGAPLGLTLMS